MWRSLLMKNKQKQVIKAIRDPKTGILFIKVLGNDNENAKSKRKKQNMSYWSTSLLIHDKDEDSKEKIVLAIE